MRKGGIHAAGFWKYPNWDILGSGDLDSGVCRP
jgi:hypothetical protein